MKITVDNPDGSSFKIKFPNWVFLNRLGVGYIAKQMAREDKMGISVSYGDAGGDEEVRDAPSRSEMRERSKRIKRALVPALREIRAFIKKNPDFVLVDAFDSEGEHVTVSF